MVSHIKSIHDETSWCGETLGAEFHFKSVEQAVLNGIHESKHIACEKCTGLIIDCLLKKVEQNGG